MDGWINAGVGVLLQRWVSNSPVPMSTMVGWQSR